MTTRFAVIASIFLVSAPAFADDDPPSTAPGTTSPSPDAPPAAPVPIKTKPTGVFELGVGFSPDEHFIAGARIAQDDLFHTGQRLALDAQISAIHQRFALDYAVPNIGGSGLELQAQLFDDRRELPGFERVSVGGDVSLVRHIDRATRVFSTLRVERVLATPDAVSLIPTASATGAQPPPLDDLAQTNTIVTAGGGIEYDTRDSLIPRHGTRFVFAGEQAMPSLGSDLSLTRFGARLEHAETFGPFTLRLGGNAGWVTSRDPGGVPMSERLYFSGNADVRGYSMYAGDTGGNLVANGHVELEVPVWKRAGLSLAGFYDAGIEQNRDIAFGPLATTVRKAVGGSVIWRSPIGPLRFDVAVPLDAPNEPKRLLFSFGAAF